MVRLLLIILTSVIVLSFTLQNLDSRVNVHFLLFKIDNASLVTLLLGIFSLGVIFNAIAAMMDANHMEAIKRVALKKKKK